jgi:hypothetical protein
LSFKDISSVGQQVDLRLQQICFWPWQWMLFRRPGWRHSPANRSHYISFFNTMWLMANDIIIGLAIGSFLIDNHLQIAGWIDWLLGAYAIDHLKSAIVWLMGWPSGLKLNNQLDSFLGELFLWLIKVWSAVLAWLQPHLPQLIKFVGVSGALGATMILSALSDLLRLTTIHFYLFYNIVARLYSWQFSVLYSLFNLFRGRKYNVLRNRVDSCDYDVDQLLLGTILFTVLFFLLPTVVVYYLLFCLVSRMQSNMHLKDNLLNSLG